MVLHDLSHALEISDRIIVLKNGCKYGEGRRIFRMTPFHHHLELGGLSGKGDKWSEWKVDAFLWTVGALASAITLWMVLGNVMK